MLLFAIALLAPIVLAQDPASAEAAVLCPAGLREMDGVGIVCPREGGLYEIFDAGLRSLGFTHGTDPVPLGAEAAPDPFVVEAGTSVNCVSGAAGTYFIQVIYARATNDADGYATWLPTIRSMVGQANQLVDDAAVATGSTASLNVKCVSGVVEVKNEVLPTAMASASFSTIVTDLRAKGYNDGKVKYWVFYDDTGACTCGGTGHLYGDDTLAITNNNNGNQASMFAVDFGYNSVRIMLHELGHNMGAVQNSAPQSTGAGHCYDGRDTMCYNDSPSPRGNLYSTAYCATEVFDCGRNDYFHASPAAGSYLATKWNLGSTLNRFITFGTLAGAPDLTTLTCPASVEEDLAFSCSFLATSSTASGVRYNVNWGDGTTSTVPTSGYATPGTTQSASKAYATPGTRTVTVSVSDSNGLNGNARTATVHAFADNPVLDLFTCPASVEDDAPLSCSMRAADNSSGVFYTVSWGGGAQTLVPPSGTVAPGVTQTAAYTFTTTGSRSVTAAATDTAGHVSSTRSATVNVVADDPVMNLLTCPTRAEEDFTFTCSLRAADALSPGVSYQIDWGDGTTTRVPASGTVAASVSQTATKAYATPGDRTVSVVATDTYGHASAPRTVTVNAFQDDPYIATLTCPAKVEVAKSMSCSVSARDNSSGLRYTVNWGDGSSVTVPATGYQSPNSTQAQSHTYASIGARTVTAQATDALGHVGPARSVTLDVVDDATPPTLTIEDPAGSVVYVGCSVDQAQPAATTGRPLLVTAGCVRAASTDAKSGVARVVVYVNGFFVGQDTTAPYQVEFDVAETALNVPVQVTAYDNAGNFVTKVVNVDTVAPPG